MISQNPAVYSTRRIIEAARERGHDVTNLNPIRCYMNITADQPTVRYRGKLVEGIEAIIPRIGPAITYYGTAVVRQFEMMGVFSLNNSIAISRARDKLRSLQILSRQGVGLPVTGFAHSTQSTDDLIDIVGGAPLVIKILEGTQGKGVVLAETIKAAESVIDAFRGLSAHFLVQEYVAESEGADIRCFVIGDRVVASMRRQARPGDFRSNLHRGGSAEEIKITATERAMALRATQALGLDVAGVDILRSHEGPMVMEVNASPGLEGIERCTGKDIAALMIQYVEENAQKRRSFEIQTDA